MKPLLVSLLALVAMACVDPQDRRPGLRLSGKVVDAPVDDWSFTRDHREIYVETRPPWLVPHSVTIVCTSLDGRLYIGARNPGAISMVDTVPPTASACSSTSTRRPARAR